MGGDKMACSAASYSDKINRLCHKCDVKGEDSGDPYVECNKIKMKTIQDLVHDNETDKLHEMNQYNVQNAWFDIDFGGCEYGIFSAACPIEGLHALENGLILYCLQVLFTKIGSSTKLGELDKLVKKLTKLPRQHYASYGSNKDMPRLLWRDGITNLKNLNATYKVGIMFTIVVVALQSEGHSYFENVLESTKSINDMIECFQMILCYWMWLKRRNIGEEMITLLLKRHYCQ